MTTLSTLFLVAVVFQTTTAAPPAFSVSARAWCENSIRLEFLPSPIPAAAAATIQKRNEMLKARGLRAIPDALSDVENSCTPGKPSSDLTTAPLHSGNLQATASNDGASIVFRQTDTGKVLFTATPTFTEQTNTELPRGGACSVGKMVGGTLGAPVNMTVDQAVWHCTTVPECKGFSVKQTSCFGGGVNTIYFKTATPFTGKGGKTDGDAAWRTWTNAGMPTGYLVSTLTLAAGGDKDERVYGLGQGNWTQEGGCPANPQRVVPLERNGQKVSLQQRKFHVTIPFIYSTAGYGFLFNMPGAGTASIGEAGVGGSTWEATASLGLSIWVTTVPAAHAATNSAPTVAKRHADRDGTAAAAAAAAAAAVQWQPPVKTHDDSAVTRTGKNNHADAKNKSMLGTCLPCGCEPQPGTQVCCCPMQGCPLPPSCPLPPAPAPAPKDANSDDNTVHPTQKHHYQQPAASIYKQYADATGHAPPLREDAMLFWQSRNRYKSSAIALTVADRYQQLKLPVGVLVIDYENQMIDGDFVPFKGCFPSLSNLSAAVRHTLNATTVFSFWPEAKNNTKNFATLKAAGCIMEPDLGGYAIDTTVEACRDLIWNTFLKPNYYDQGVSSYWLDETDGEGTGIADGEYGYDTSYGPAPAYNNLWVGSWLGAFSEPVKKLGREPPLVLTRGVWAGGQKHGVVLWSSDIWSSFEELEAQVPEGVHASLSGIPWWSTDVGGYGCGQSKPNHTPYMQELMIRWYQFGCFSPIFRTHGCRTCAQGDDCQQEPDVAPCVGIAGSCAANEVWSYGAATQTTLEKYIRLRATLKPYIAALAANVTLEGVPTVRPLWWEFPTDANAVGVNSQFMLGPDYLVAPVTVQGATNRSIYFPTAAATSTATAGTAGTAAATPPGAAAAAAAATPTTWYHVFDGSVVVGGQTVVVHAPLDIIPVYTRMKGHRLLLV